MYGNAPFGAEVDEVTLTAEQQRTLRRDLATVADRTRNILPEEFAVGSELTSGVSGPRATVSVQPPFGPVVSADYTPDGDDLEMAEDVCDDLVHELAASAALQVKQAIDDDDRMIAR